MIRCKPHGICSWSFALDGEGHQGSTELGWFGEQGAIVVDGARFMIDKGGLFSGYWTLTYQGDEVASAQKLSAFTRTFEIEDPGGRLALRAESPIRRIFRLERSDDLIAMIRPEHALTRRATIEILTDRWDAPTIYFAFWLVVLMWRRAAQSNGG